MKYKFIFALHGTAFTAFTFLSMLINTHVTTFLQSAFNFPWLVKIVDLLISGFLYVALYMALYNFYKLVNVHIKKEILPIGGKWYHVHFKRDENGLCINTDVLRAGETKVCQDLCEVHFAATNYSYRLLPTGELEKESSELRNTGWCSWAVDWKGKENLITCYKACTQTKNGREFTDRHGIHKLKIEKDRMSGKFADEYPSASRGDVYFFRSEQQRDHFIKQCFEEIRRTHACDQAAQQSQIIT